MQLWYFVTNLVILVISRGKKNLFTPISRGKNLIFNEQNFRF